MKWMIFGVLLLLLATPVLAASKQDILASLDKLSQEQDREEDFENLGGGSRDDGGFEGSMILVFLGGIIVAVAIGLFLLFKKRKKFGVIKTNAQEGKDVLHIHADGQVVNYIKGARAAGMDDEEIRKNLVSVGWSGDVVNEGFRKL